jgi:hypothetical protein
MHPDVDEYGLDPISTIVVGGVMFILTAIALSLRVYVRGFLIKSLGWDDRLLCFAFFLYTGNCIILILMGATQAVDGIKEVSANRKLAKVRSRRRFPGTNTDSKCSLQLLALLSGMRLKYSSSYLLHCSSLDWSRRSGRDAPY